MEEDDTRNDLEKLLKILGSAGASAKPKPKVKSGIGSTVSAWVVLLLASGVAAVTLGFFGRLVAFGYNLASKLF